MCFYFPSAKNHTPESGGREAQWRYVRKRAGGRVVSRQIMRGDQAVRLQGLSPRVVLVPPDRTTSDQEEVEVVLLNTEDEKTRGRKPARPSATIKSEKRPTASKKTDQEITGKKSGTAGVPSWDSWEKNDEKSSDQDLNKPSGDWIVQYVEKADAKKSDSNEKSSKSTPSQKAKGKKGERNSGKQNGKGSGKKRIVSNANSEKGQGNASGDNKTTPDWDTTEWETTENKGDSGNSNESAWAPADAGADIDWQRQDGWEPEPEGTNNVGKPEENTNKFDDWDAIPGDNWSEENNNSEENDNMQKIPGAWPENDSDQNNSAKAKQGQVVSKKDKKQANRQQGNAKGSKKPMVKGKGAKATVEFCVCEADNSVSFKSAQEIQENCQPGEWQQDEHGNPFFQRAQEENTSDNQAWENDNQGNSADTQTGFVDTSSPNDGW